MKKRSISFVLVFMMLLSITVHDRIVYAQQSDPPVEEASAQKEELGEPEADTGADKMSVTTMAEEPQGEPEADTGADKMSVTTMAEEPQGEPEADTGAGEMSVITMEEPQQSGAEPEAEGGEISGGESDESGAPEFDESQPFTMAMLDESGDVEAYEIDMEKTGISLDKFRIETETEDGRPGTCQLEFPAGLKEIKAGELKNTAPALLGDEEHGNGHGYSYAHVGNTEVFYIGHLTVHDGEQTEEYTVYTTDQHIDKRTVYVVLKENEQISLVYRHGTYHTVNYQFQTMSGEVIQEGREESDWTYDKIFGSDRIRSVSRGKDFNGTITIPRGYRAKVIVSDEQQTLHSSELGKMKQYTYNTQFANQIPLAPGCEDALRFKDSFVVEDVEKDITVSVQYEKIESFTFNAWYWTQTAYAGGPSNRPIRISVVTAGNPDAVPSEANCKVKFGSEQGDTEDGNSFTWSFKGISAGGYTYEMDQLEINGEPIAVPMVSVADKGSTTTTTTLSTGTVITMKATSLGGTNGRDAKREYTLTAENCYEDLTFSGGNMVSHAHKEFAVRGLIGVEDSSYWHGTDTDGQWWQLKQNTLIAHTNKTAPDSYNTFRMKLARGYKKLNVTFTDKETNILQTNDNELPGGTKNNFIKYLIREDDGSGPEREKGTYREVPYDEWVPSEDGYYYCKATPELHNYMQQSAKNGVVLLWFYADANMYGIDYQDGAGGDAAPAADDITNLPPYQDGGEKGYNLFDNTKALVSNHIPIDTKGKFLFDHWEVLKANEDGPTSEVKKDAAGNAYMLEAGGNLPLTPEALQELSDCLYYNSTQKRNTLTLRAVWRSTEGKAPIPYTVNYYITEIKQGTQFDEPTLLEGHQHMANEGAMLVADLWQDSNKTLSPIITEILEGDNNQKEDYTKGGTVQYIIYEPLTDKKLENISAGNDVLNIYLVKQPNLTVSKVVEGKHGDLTKPFKFTIELSKGGVLLNGTYKFTGDVVDDVKGVAAPVDGTLTFTDGKAEVSLSHGQQITFTDLPFGSYYTVEETAEDGYKAVYDGDGDAKYAEGVLESDKDVLVVNTRADIPDMGIMDDSKRFRMMLCIGTAALLLLAVTGIRRMRRKG